MSAVIASDTATLEAGTYIGWQHQLHTVRGGASERSLLFSAENVLKIVFSGIGLRVPRQAHLTNMSLVFRLPPRCEWNISLGRLVDTDVSAQHIRRDRCCPEKSVNNYQSTLQNILEERISHLSFHLRRSSRPLRDP
jgi:hypothetical protein